MADIFNSSPGSVLVVNTQGAVPMQLVMDGFTQQGSAYGPLRSIVTSIGLGQQGNFQFMHTLRNFIYVYVFGERVADLAIGGICFLQPCNNQSGPTTLGSISSGFDLMYQYYQRNRIAQLGTPLNIAIGSTIAIQVMLVGMNLIAQDPTNGMGQFTLNLKYFADQGDSLSSNVLLDSSVIAPVAPASSSPDTAGNIDLVDQSITVGGTTEVPVSPLTNPDQVTTVV